MRIKCISILLLIFGAVSAQTTVNPDISVIGELGLSYEDDVFGMNASSVELAIQGYVNPYARADVYLHKHMDDEPIELEEAVLTIERGLPLGLALRAGKFRPGFGKINGEHMHLAPYILIPEPVAQILGEEKWASAGLEVKWLLPLPWYSDLALAYLQDGITAGAHHYDADEHEHVEDSTPALSTRLSMFFDLGTVSHLELGASYYQVSEKPEQNMLGIDLKYKWRPDKYTALDWQTELFRRSAYTHLDEGEEEDNPEVIAIYSMLDFQFKKRWNAGFIADYSSSLDDENYQSNGLFFGYSPAEETTVFRMFFKQENHGNEPATLKVEGQLLWSLGPHKAHQF